MFYKRLCKHLKQFFLKKSLFQVASRNNLNYMAAYVNISNSNGFQNWLIKMYIHSGMWYIFVLVDLWDYFPKESTKNVS